MANKSVTILAGAVIVAVPIFCLVLGNSSCPRGVISYAERREELQVPTTQGKPERNAVSKSVTSVVPEAPKKEDTEKLAKLKDELFITNDIRRKWEILCAFADEPAIERVFATEEERFRLNQITDEVINAIDTGAFEKGGPDDQVD